MFNYLPAERIGYCSRVISSNTPGTHGSLGWEFQLILILRLSWHYLQIPEGTAHWF